MQSTCFFAAIWIAMHPVYVLSVMGLMVLGCFAGAWYLLFSDKKLIDILLPPIDDPQNVQSALSCDKNG